MRFTGLAFQRILFKPIKSNGILVQLFTLVGLAYLINGIVGAIAGKRMLSFDIPISRVVKVGDIYLVTPYEFMIFRNCSCNCYISAYLFTVHNHGETY